MGYNVDFVDCGGGLGVDYDGTRSPNSESSVNYSIQEYVNDCIYTFVEAADRNGIPHPNLITESGRSLSAHHSVLVIDVLETASLPEMPEEYEPNENSHKLVKDLYDIWDNRNPRTILEDWHDAEQIREDALDLFEHGLVDLKTRAEIERMYWSVCREINSISKSFKHVPEELKGLDKLLADKYFCNFSLFQSLPDAWAIDQIFLSCRCRGSTSAPDTQRHAAGHHVRQRRKDSQLRDQPQHLEHPAGARAAQVRALLSGRVPRGRRTRKMLGNMHTTSSATPTRRPPR